MKKFNFFLLLLGVVALSSCSTYQYSARQTNVARRSINTYEQMASIDVDYSKQVTATSKFQHTVRAAIQEAELLCLQENNIDVIVDPVIKVKTRPLRLLKRHQATVTGYVGIYKEEQTVEKTKQYTLEEIEKYKLLTDPNFPQYYYKNGVYYIGSPSTNYKSDAPMLFQTTNIQDNSVDNSQNVADYMSTNKSKSVKGSSWWQRVKAKR